MSNSPFESVALVAIEEMIKKHLSASRFGHFMSEEGLQDLKEEFYRFLVTSRELKSAGDRMIAKQAHSQSQQRPVYR